MRKVSELIELGLPVYSESNQRFMCCVLTDDYAAKGAKRLNLTAEEKREAKITIAARIEKAYTLDCYLRNTDPEYQAYRYNAEGVQIGDYRDDFPLEKRIAFYKAFIEELKAKGE